MKIPDLFIFDMDGTMFDTEPISYGAWQAACREFGYELPKELFCSVIGMDNRRICDVFYDHFGSSFPYEEICREKVRLQMTCYKEQTVPEKAGLRTLLAFAKQQGSRCAVASSSPEGQICALLEKAGLDAAFDVVQSGEFVARGKPEPDIFLETCRRAGTEPARALVLEDSANGLLAASRAGIPSVFIPDMAPVPEEVELLTWRKCRTLADVPPLFAGEAQS